MKITICSMKGGCGKTDISLNLALMMDYGIITNDFLSPLEDILEKNRFIKLKPSEELREISGDYDIIFDLGGYLDLRMINALKQSDWVIIPLINEYKDLSTTVNFIQEIEEYNNNILIIANKTKKGDYDDIKEVMQRYYSYPVFEIKYSRALPNLMKEKKSIKDMRSEGGLKAYFYKLVEKQFDLIIETLNSKKKK